MRNRLLYRVQDKRGRGPFAPGFSKWWAESRDDYGNLLPWFVEFSGFWPTLKGKELAFGVACMTRQQLRRWFTQKEYKKLVGFGYQAVEIDYARILVFSDIQCVFTRKKPLNHDVKKFDLYDFEAKLSNNEK